MHDVLELFNVRNGSSVLTLRLYNPLSSVTSIYGVTFIVGKHDGTARFWGVSGDFLAKFTAQNKNKYLQYEMLGIVMLLLQTYFTQSWTYFHFRGKSDV